MSATLELVPETVQALADSTHALSSWREQGRQLAKADNARQWEVGDWLLAGEEKLGRKLYSEALAIFTGYHHSSSLKQFAYVARHVPASIRIDALSWAHHQLVARFPKPEYQKELLAKAVECNWPLAAFREHINEKNPPKRNKKKDSPITFSLPSTVEDQVMAVAKKRGVPYKEAVLYLVQQALAAEKPKGPKVLPADAKMDKKLHALFAANWARATEKSQSKREGVAA